MSVISCKSCGAVVDDAWGECPQCGADPRMGATEFPLAETPTVEAPPASRGAPSTTRSLSTEPSPDATSSDLGERRRRQRLKPKKASAVGIVVFALLVVASILIEVYDSPEYDKSKEYNQLMDQITVVDERIWATPGKIDGLLANDVLAPLITRNGAEVTVHDPGMSGAAHLQRVLQEAKAVIAGNDQDLTTLAGLWEKVARLQTGAERDEYARQMQRLTELDHQIGVLSEQYFGTLAEACEQSPLSRSEQERFGQEASDILARIEPLQSQYRELSSEADQYYNEHFR